MKGVPLILSAAFMLLLLSGAAVATAGGPPPDLPESELCQAKGGNFYSGVGPPPADLWKCSAIALKTGHTGDLMVMGKEAEAIRRSFDRMCIQDTGNSAMGSLDTVAGTTDISCPS